MNQLSAKFSKKDSAVSIRNKEFKAIHLTRLLIFFSLTVCYAQVKQQDNNPADQKIEILFIGNSLTYMNNLPKMVKLLGKEHGFIIKTQQIALPNYALIDHLNDGNLQSKIANNSFDYVVIQQGPSSQEAGRKLLLESSTIIANLCAKSKSKMAVFMVWPALKHYQTFEDVILNYTEAAKLNDAILCPVGKIWKAHFDKTKNFDYYGTDGFHPSEKGSRIAAEVIFESLFQHN